MLPSERSDAVYHESRFPVRVDGRLRFRIESPFRSILVSIVHTVEDCNRRKRRGRRTPSVWHLSIGADWLVTTVERYETWRSSQELEQVDDGSPSREVGPAPSRPIATTSVLASESSSFG